MERLEHTNRSDENVDDEKFATLLASIVVGFFFNTYEYEESNRLSENIERQAK
ncbi:hypothetical protein [Dyadobacter diqingensis]|uniref:hypothetical protein n=1 Tax=Dyadobacter diqingensis TaxID=2938121 RepID=UPI0020C19D1E|nr:hypothetical protein [Dyadobacter diqingensis]